VSLNLARVEHKLVAKENHNILGDSNGLSIDTDVSRPMPSLYVTDRASKALSCPSALQGSVDMVRPLLRRSLSVSMRTDKV
jgi:hypothetical protein